MYLRMRDFAFISKLQEFVVLHTWTKNCAIQYCCVALMYDVMIKLKVMVLL